VLHLWDRDRPATGSVPYVSGQPVSNTAAIEENGETEYKKRLPQPHTE